MATGSVVWYQMRIGRNKYDIISGVEAGWDSQKDVLLGQSGGLWNLSLCCNRILNSAHLFLHYLSVLLSLTQTIFVIATKKKIGSGIGTAPGAKVFTVRPITSWIDKLASEHGSPTGQPPSSKDSAPKYQKRGLVLKTMKDSYTEIILPFSTDKALLEEYINWGGAVR